MQFRSHGNPVLIILKKSEANTCFTRSLKLHVRPTLPIHSSATVRPWFPPLSPLPDPACDRITPRFSQSIRSRRCWKCTWLAHSYTRTAVLETAKSENRVTRNFLEPDRSPVWLRIGCSINAANVRPPRPKGFQGYDAGTARRFSYHPSLWLILLTVIPQDRPPKPSQRRKPIRSVKG